MSTGDRLLVKVVHDGRRIVEVIPSLQRSVTGVMALLQGREPELGMTLVERLFSICTHAHGVAGRRALAMARGERPDTDADGNHEARLAVERIRESALRLLTGWDLAEGNQNSTRDLLALITDLLAGLTRGGHVRQMKGQVAELSDLLRSLYGNRNNQYEWIEKRTCQWKDIRLGPGTCALTPAREREIEAALAADRNGEFCKAPVLDGQIYMTGPSASLSQQRDGAQYIASVLRALFAQIDRDILRLQKGPRALLRTLDDYGQGVGCGWALSARGWLLHRVELVDERVQKWQILAPTDWNFHGTGVLRQRLLGVEVPPSRLEPLVNDLILSVDPCVSFEVSVSHA